MHPTCQPQRAQPSLPVTARMGHPAEGLVSRSLGPHCSPAVAQVQAVLQQKEEEDRQTRQLVQALQTALESEKLLVHGLREQVAAAKMEAGHNRRHFKAATLELSEVKKELQAKELLVQTLQTEAEGLR